MSPLFNTLLYLHIAAGTATLISSIVAIGSKLMDVAHNTHKWSGRVWMWGMTGIFITGMGMSLIRVNPPMLFISLLSFYFAWIGWRYALNRRGEPAQLDIAVSGIMLLVFIGMFAYGIYANFVLGEPFGTVIFIFGIIGGINAYGDFKTMRVGEAKGKERIALHLSRMLGGTIAAVTAFFVVNISFNILVWLLPSIVLTPLIWLWERKIRAGVRRKGMPS